MKVTLNEGRIAYQNKTEVKKEKKTVTSNVAKKMKLLNLKVTNKMHRDFERKKRFWKWGKRQKKEFQQNGWN